MEEPKTLEDLAMGLVRGQHPKLYGDYISLLYRGVKETILGLGDILKGKNITLESSFVDDLHLNEWNITKLRVNIETKYNVNIPNKKFSKIHNVGDFVDYLASNPAIYNKDIENNDNAMKAKQLVENSLMEVNKAYEAVQDVIKACCDTHARARYVIRGLFGMGCISPDAELLKIEGMNKKKLTNQFKLIFGSQDEVEKYVNGTLYDVVKYVTKRDVKLAVPVNQ